MERQREGTQQLRVITDPGVTLVQFPVLTKACRSSSWVLDSLLWPPSSLHLCGIHIHRYTQKHRKNEIIPLMIKKNTACKENIFLKNRCFNKNLNKYFITNSVISPYEVQLQ